MSGMKKIRTPKAAIDATIAANRLGNKKTLANAIDTTPGLSELEKTNAKNLAKNMDKWGGSSALEETLGKTNVGKIVKDPAKALDPADPDSISRQLASADDLKDPVKFQKDFKDDLNKLANEDYTSLKTDAAKRIGDGMKKKAASRDSVKKYIKYAAIATAIGGGIAGILAAWAKENSGCYIISPDGTQTKACKQSNCSEGSTCGNADGTPRSDGKCCDGGRRTVQGETCSCVEKTMNDGFENIAGGVIDGMTSLVDTLTQGAGMFVDLITFVLQNLPAFLMIGALLFFAPMIISAIRTTKETLLGTTQSTGGTQILRIETPVQRPSIVEK